MRLPVVIVVQAAQYGARVDLSTPGLPSPSRWMTWNPLPNALVWPGVIEVHLVLLHNSMQLVLAQEQEEVQTVSPYTTQKPLTDRIHLRRLSWPKDVIRQGAAG